MGKDLRSLADDFGITVFKDGKMNKGWAGHVIERYLGLPMNSSRAPNFGSWELKVFPIVDRNGILRVKETIAITMLDPHEVLAKVFTESHLYTKLKKLLVVSRIFESVHEKRSVVFSLGEFDLGNDDVFNRVKRDYDLIRETIREGGFEALSGRLGEVIQPRTKGAGHGSTSRAFYARTKFVHQIAGLDNLSMLHWSRTNDGIWSYAPP